MTLPHFKYHPDPLSTGSIEESNAICKCCGKTCGYIYKGTAFSVQNCHACICPWCIADGSAHEALDVCFTAEMAIGGFGKLWNTGTGYVFRRPSLISAIPLLVAGQFLRGLLQHRL